VEIAIPAAKKSSRKMWFLGMPFAMSKAALHARRARKRLRRRPTCDAFLAGRDPTVLRSLETELLTEKENLAGPASLNQKLIVSAKAIGSA
jgi:hypothetical protein